ncbi:SHD1 domain-containing protein [Blastopirellula marina]|uniref:SLA1 homology domain-containing protein n=1 Tax=Blastopirellula marina TaxID=124 RepID=A0A2S8GJX0_9BACT|nr:SHD1 domain-containing protein [Blastopirellula marina]PQO44737.1 hypothetical protein C5Y93_18410 [Blastopirellula marina]
MIDSVQLLAAGDEEGKGLALLVFFGLSILFFGLGVYGIVTKTVLLRARDVAFFRMFGVKEFSPGFAVVTGLTYCLCGIFMFVAATAVSMGFSLDNEGKGKPVAKQDAPAPERPGPAAPADRNGADAENGRDQVGEQAMPSPLFPQFDEEEEAAPQLDEEQRRQQQAEQEAARREQERMNREAEDRTRQQQEEARKAALTLPAPPQPLSQFAYVDRSVQESKLLGKAKGERFMDRAPEGGVMVGAIFFIGDHFGNSIAGIQPIYQVGDKYVKGAICGNETDRPVQLLAEAGGVVAGMKVNAGLVMDSAQLAFGPLKGTKIDPKQGYFGQTVGSDGGSPNDFYAEGHAIAGIFGTYETDKSLMSLGMYVITRMQESAPAPTSEPEMRTYTSADGKFQVEAKLLKVNADGTISLLKKDGKEISVPLTSLSEADRTFVQSQQ